MMKQKLGVIGIGMVGTPLARFFADIAGHRRGKDLFLYDIDPVKRCSDDINNAEIIFLCVPSPRLPRGNADLSCLDKAICTLEDGKIVVIKSTVPPGTTEHFQKQFPQHRLLFNPEFLTEQLAWENTLCPDRQMVGYTRESKDVAKTVLSCLPRALLSAPSRGFEITATEAELIKYAANIFLARKVTFANAVFDLASRHGADYEHIRKGIASDSRIGPSHLDVFHGGYRGYGGYCFIKDTDALIAHARDVGLHEVGRLVDADRSFNEHVLATQGLKPEDVAIHDQEWIEKRVAQRKV